MLVPSTTRRALSNGMERFSITHTISPKILKYWYFTIKVAVFSAFGGYGFGYEESDHRIGHSSSLCTWNKHEKFGTMFLDEYGTILLEYGANFTYVYKSVFFSQIKHHLLMPKTISARKHESDYSIQCHHSRLNVFHLLATLISSYTFKTKSNSSLEL
jgi:hypothetical protein